MSEMREENKISITYWIDLKGKGCVSSRKRDNTSEIKKSVID
jgi:hypothetical protein